MVTIFDTHKVCDLCKECLHEDECKDRGWLKYCMKERTCEEVCGELKCKYYNGGESING